MPPPQLPLVDDAAGSNDNDEGVESVSCDFTNVDSVNEFYPKQEGKSKKHINVFTLSMLNKLEMAEQKDHFCRRWRMCANISGHAALKDLAAQEEARASLAADDDDDISHTHNLP